MNSFILGIFLGSLIGATTMYIAFGEDRKSDSKAYNEGALSVIDKLESEFGVIPYSNKNYEKVVASIKTTEVVSVYENGVKTIKVTKF